MSISVFLESTVLLTALQLLAVLLVVMIFSQTITGISLSRRWNNIRIMMKAAGMRLTGKFTAKAAKASRPRHKPRSKPPQQSKLADQAGQETEHPSES